MRPERVILIHIPKAAGQTMRSIVAKQYPRHEILTLEGRLGQTSVPVLDEARMPRMVLGHVPFGLHLDLPGSYVYATILREPVSRVLSLYRYIATNPRHHLHEQVVKGSLFDFVSGQIDVEEVDNGQTRQLLGVTGGSLNDSDLVRAKQNLADFAVVGLVERFDESILLFRKRLGWAMPYYVRKNVGRKSVASRSADDEALQVIRFRNKLDAELYEFGHDLLDEQIRREGRRFQAELKIFRVLNEVARTYRNGREWSRRMGRRRGSKN